MSFKRKLLCYSTSALILKMTKVKKKMSHKKQTTLPNQKIMYMLKNGEEKNMLSCLDLATKLSKSYFKIQQKLYYLLNLE